MNNDERSCVFAICLIMLFVSASWVVFMLGLALAVRLAGTL